MPMYEARIRMSKKALVLAHTAYHLERFCKENMLTLKKLGYEVHIAADFGGENPMPKAKLEEFRSWLEGENIKPHQISFTKSAVNLSQHIRSYKECKRLFEAEQYDLMHCHTPIGAAVARMAAKHADMKVIYTAHGFHFFEGASKKNWLIYYPVEKYLSRYTDVQITINQEDYNRATAKLRARHTEYVPGVGMKLDRFCDIESQRSEIRSELGLEEKDICLLSIGELSVRKNHKVVLDALERLGRSDIKYVICGMGQLEQEIAQRVAGSELLQKTVQLLSFRSDIPQVCGAIDIFVFPSLQEGLPVGLMEAMAAGMPCVVSKIRGNVDLIDDDKGGILVDKCDVEGYAKAIAKLADDIAKRSDMSAYNLEKIKGFTTEIVESQIEKIYKSIG